MADEIPPEQPPHQRHDRETGHHPTQDLHEQIHHPVSEHKKSEPAPTDLDISDEEEENTESRHHRSHGGGHRGGKPPKKVYEEWANDPYCE